MNKNTQIKLTGSHYDPAIPGMLREYASSNPYLNISSTYAIADVFGVSHQTISNWMKEHPEFKEAVCDLRMHTLNRVESAMMKLILGYTVTEKKTVRTGEETSEQMVEKEIPPNAALIRYYLEHRCPSRWAEKEKSVQQPMEDEPWINAEDRPEDVA